MAVYSVKQILNAAVAVGSEVIAVIQKRGYRL